MRQLSVRLSEIILDYTVVSCFSQSKDELVIELNNSKKSFFIKANLSQGLCCLSFPESFHRARKNSVDLFKEVILKKIIGVRQFKNERSFALQLEGDSALLFKMHGNFANVLFFKDGKVAAIFRNHLSPDFETRLEEIDRQIDFSKENFIKCRSQFSATYFTFGKIIFEYLENKNFNQQEIDDQWKLFEQTLKLLAKPNFYLAERKGQLVFTLLPVGEIIKEFDDPVLAVTEFAERSVREQVFYAEKKSALHMLQTKIKGSENYKAKAQQKLEELVNNQHYQLWADLLMANMHLVKTGQEKIELSNFYDGSPVSIKLKPELSAQKNAEVFYRKAKNQQIETNKLKASGLQKEKEMVALSALTESISLIADLKTLRKKIEEAGLVKIPQAEMEILPFHQFKFKGYKIWVGKNAEANDKLTLKHSYKEDLWLHAKDVAGSHVLIKHQAGRIFPKEVIEHAAGLAAHYSKRKNETLCPVAFTPKKFVRKRKGDPAGMVVVEREEVILAEPIVGSRA